MTHESFEEFKNSFAYGSRTDLSFKFLKALSDADAADFFQDLLTKLGESLDDGQLDRLIEHVVAWQVKGYGMPSKWQYADTPFVALEQPLAQAKVGLLTSTGHFMEGDDPEPFGVKNMDQTEAAERIIDFLKVAPTLSEIPFGANLDLIRVRHGGYDIRGVQSDINVALPLDRMKEQVASGRIGQLTNSAYSFVGAAAQRRLIKKAIPEWIKLFQSQNIDAVVMIPV